MFKRSLSSWLCLLAGGMVLLALPTCAQYTASLAQVSQIATAGAVLFLVSRVMK
jgi:hypothetical protein